MRFFFTIVKTNTDGTYVPSNEKFEVVFKPGVLLSKSRELAIIKNLVYSLQFQYAKRRRENPESAGYKAIIEISLNDAVVSAEELPFVPRHKSFGIAASTNIIGIRKVHTSNPEFDVAFNCTINGAPEGRPLEWLVPNKAFLARTISSSTINPELTQAITAFCEGLVAKKAVAGRYAGKALSLFLVQDGQKVAEAKINIPSPEEAMRSSFDLIGLTAASVSTPEERAAAYVTRVVSSDVQRVIASVSAKPHVATAPASVVSSYQVTMDAIRLFCVPKASVASAAAAGVIVEPLIKGLITQRAEASAQILNSNGNEGKILEALEALYKINMQAVNIPSSVLGKNQLMDGLARVFQRYQIPSEKPKDLTSLVSQIREKVRELFADRAARPLTLGLQS